MGYDIPIFRPCLSALTQSFDRESFGKNLVVRFSLNCRYFIEMKIRKLDENFTCSH
jgi:hypothetical protein